MNQKNKEKKNEKKKSMMKEIIQYPQVKDTNKILSYILLFLLIATTGFPYFYDATQFLVASFLFVMLLTIFKKIKLDYGFLLVIAFFGILELFQALLFENFNFATFISIFIKLFLAYFTLKKIGDNFISYYINFMLVFSLISLLFYSLYFVPGVYMYMYDNFTPPFTPPYYKTIGFFEPTRNIIIFTFDKGCFDTFRNPGPFWEPGTYSIFLIIAMILNIIKTKTLFNKRNIVFIITLGTTVSTAGYVALFALFFAYISSNTNQKYRAIYLILIVLISSLMYFNLYFLSDKVDKNIEMKDQGTYSRFGSLVADWKSFTESPIIGLGRGEKRYGADKFTFFSIEEHRNNGVAAILVQYGAPFFIIYFYLYYLTFKQLCKKYAFNQYFAIYAVITILLLGFSQTIFTRQFFLVFLVWGIVLKNQTQRIPNLSLKTHFKKFYN